MVDKMKELRYVQERNTGTVLSFEQRGPYGSSDYNGNCSGYIPLSIMEKKFGSDKLLNKEIKVAEVYAGSGTLSDVCKLFELNYKGIDINPNPIRPDIVSMDILDMDKELPDEFNFADFLFYHPPYPVIKNISYSGNRYGAMYKASKEIQAKDIQNMGWSKGMAAINKSIMRGYSAMPSGSYMAVLVGDIRNKGKLYSMLNGENSLVIPGELDQVLIKMQHNTASGRSWNANSRRNFFLIEHEYVIVIKKPSGYEITFVLPQRYETDIRDSKTATWQDVVLSIVREQKEVTNASVTDALRLHKKSKNNPNFEAKIRQTLQKLADKGLIVHTGRATWRVA